jgi:hypothetical protein
MAARPRIFVRTGYLGVLPQTQIFVRIGPNFEAQNPKILSGRGPGLHAYLLSGVLFRLAWIADFKRWTGAPHRSISSPVGTHSSGKRNAAGDVKSRLAQPGTDPQDSEARMPEFVSGFCPRWGER